MASNPRRASTVEAAVILDRSPTTRERWRQTGRGPRFLRVEGRIEYELAELEAFLERCRRDPAAHRPDRDAAA